VAELSQMGLLYHQLIYEFGALVEQRTAEMRSVRRKPCLSATLLKINPTWSIYIP